MERQKALRKEVEEAQLDLMGMTDRAYKRHIKIMDKQNFDMAKAVDKSKAEKAAGLQKELRAWKSEVSDRATTMRDLRTVRIRNVLRQHDRFLRSHTKFKQDDRARRMEALKV